MVEKRITWNANKTLWGGILFSLIFTAIIWAVRPLLLQVDFLPDAGPAWYYWKLPEATFWSRATAWGGYLLHQVALWGLIYYAQKSKLKYTGGLHKFNLIALGVNAFFIVLHLFQTAFWYDGLAQDVSIFSSQGSVILMLVMILLMENQRRGLFFGKKINFLRETGQVARKYHGYIFAWAVVYTFWYHPMENTIGHLLGFLYTFFLMLQGSLMFTRAHLNKYWTAVLEVMVLIHGAIVAIQTQTIWPMFLFGFLTLFIVTQMHGLGLSRAWKWLFVAIYTLSVIIVYSSRGWANVNEVLRIPIIEYALVFVLALIIWLGMLIGRQVSKWVGRLPTTSQQTASGD